MSLEIFFQATYRDTDKNLFFYGCYFLTLCLVSQMYQMTPAVILDTKEKLLSFKALAQKKGWLDEDCTVLNGEAILNHLTGKKFELVKDPVWGFGGKSHALPINYPTKKTDIVIDCFRATQNTENTHFTLRGVGDKTVFNTLGLVWENRHSDRFFKTDKRVYREVS